LAAELAPDDPRVKNGRAWLIVGDSGTPDGVAALEEAARAAPDDFDVHQRLDYAIAAQRNFVRIIEMWTDYLSRHPDDGRAYLERGGAYVHLGKPKEAYTDATKGCSLGVSEACVRAKQIEPMAR
jgi:Flp pilus assembly protein TadD